MNSQMAATIPAIEEEEDDTDDDNEARYNHTERKQNEQREKDRVEFARFLGKCSRSTALVGKLKKAKFVK